MISTVLSPSGRNIKYLGRRHREYIIKGLMKVPNELKAYYSLKDTGKILFLKKKKVRKNLKTITGYEEQEIINPDLITERKETFRSKGNKITKEIMKKIKQGKFYKNKELFKETTHTIPKTDTITKLTKLSDEDISQIATKLDETGIQLVEIPPNASKALKTSIKLENKMAIENELKEAEQ
jgi:hypothetical protein